MTGASRKIIKPTEGQGRVVLAEPSRDHVKPADRLAEHRASMRPGPNPGSSVRMTLRTKLGDEKPTVRKMYDRTSKPKRRKKS